ncbi:MAG: thioredoxin family protein [Ignavibacteriales bacterium]|nr:MAG: thioredoxin family protein [Ignavibacteriales bacterium]
MGRPFFLDSVKTNGLTYNQYFQRTVDDSVKILPADANEIQTHRHSMLKLNVQRMKRVEKTFSVSEEMAEEISKINEKQTWMIISEPWCGDSAQIIPVLANIASANTLIDLKIILRDENSEIMDLYVTEDNKRSIPVLVIFDEAGEELLRWGSRPEVVEKLVKDLKSQGLTKDEWLVKLHLWYAQNKGIEIEREILAKIRMDALTI